MMLSPRPVQAPSSATGAADTAVFPTPPAGLPVRLRIAFITRRFGARFGGAEAYGERVMAELAQRHDVHVFCQEWDSPLALAHTTLARRESLPRWLNLVDFGRRCAPLVRDYDIVHSHENLWVGDVQVVHVVPVRYSRFHKGRGWLRGVLDRTNPRWLTYLALESMRLRDRPGHAVVAASGLIAEQVATAYPEIAPSVIIPPAVTPPDHPPSRAAAREALQLDADAVYLLLIANDPERKGVATILQALQHLPSRVRLLSVGGDAAMAAHVGQLADRAGQGARVQAWPARRDVQSFYAAADVCVFPTRGDAFGMVPLEAMAHGLPVVMSTPRHCGFASHVVDGRDALLLDDPTDALTLARHVQRLLDEPAVVRQLTAAGHELATQFTWPATAQRFEALYATLLRAPSAQAGLPGQAAH